MTDPEMGPTEPTMEDLPLEDDTHLRGPDGLTDEERNFPPPDLDECLGSLAATVVTALSEPEKRDCLIPLIAMQRERALERGRTHPEEIPTLESLEARHGPNANLDDLPDQDPVMVNRAVYAGLLVIELFQGGPSILRSMGLLQDVS